MYRNSIIYMAAGSGRRFGSNKLLYEFKEKPLYRHALDKIIEYVSVRPDTELIVVTRYDEICEYVKQYICSNIIISYSPQSVEGISYTIHNGISAADNASDGFYFFVTADQPCLRIDTLDGLIKAMQSGKYICGRVKSHGTPGNPTAFSHKLRDELMMLAGDEGGRKIIKAHMDSCLEYETEDERETADIDVVEDIGLL